MIEIINLWIDGAVFLIEWFPAFLAGAVIYGSARFGFKLKEKFGGGL